MQVIDLGQMSWRDAWAHQEQAHERVMRGGEEVLFLVEHPHVITLGRQADLSLRNLRYSREELLRNGIEVVETDRGGNVTYHGPGQLVAYPIVKLATHRFTVGGYVRALQESVIDCLGRCMLKARVDPEAVGVWTEDRTGQPRQGLRDRRPRPPRRHAPRPGAERRDRPEILRPDRPLRPRGPARHLDAKGARHARAADGARQVAADQQPRRHAHPRQPRPRLKIHADPRFLTAAARVATRFLSMDDPIELEPSAGLSVRPDLRRPMPEPPPVWLASVADVHLPVATTRADVIDAFYVDLLRFVRQPTLERGIVVYRAANFDLRFDVREPPVARDSIAPTEVIVPSLYLLRPELVAREVPFDYCRGIDPGVVFILCQDPAGNWLELSDARPLA